MYFSAADFGIHGLFCEKRVLCIGRIYSSFLISVFVSVSNFVLVFSVHLLIYSLLCFRFFFFQIVHLRKSQSLEFQIKNLMSHVILGCSFYNTFLRLALPLLIKPHEFTSVLICL